MDYDSRNVVVIIVDVTTTLHTSNTLPFPKYTQHALGREKNS